MLIDIFDLNKKVDLNKKNKKSHDFCQPWDIHKSIPIYVY